MRAGSVGPPLAYPTLSQLLTVQPVYWCLRSIRWKAHVYYPVGTLAAGLGLGHADAVLGFLPRGGIISFAQLLKLRLQGKIFLQDVRVKQVPFIRFRTGLFVILNEKYRERMEENPIFDFNRRWSDNPVSAHAERRPFPCLGT